jgi:hypothetical protein
MTEWQLCEVFAPNGAKRFEICSKRSKTDWLLERFNNFCSSGAKTQAKPEHAYFAPLCLSGAN